MKDFQAKEEASRENIQRFKTVFSFEAGADPDSIILFLSSGRDLDP
jgi:hypothetical protein